MEMQRETALTSCNSQTQICSSSSSLVVESEDLHNTMMPRPRLSHRQPHFSTPILNRIFVGGIDDRITEPELWHVFSQLGAVKGIKIVVDRAGVSKGYGFVTFETQEDAQKILHGANKIYFKNNMFNIGQAVQRLPVGRHNKCFPPPSPSPGAAVPGLCTTMYLTTAGGYPYTYHNGVAYFHSLDTSTPAHHWPHSASTSPMLLSHPPQPVYQQPAYQQPAYQHYQCVPNHLQWTVPQTLVASNPAVYMQSEYINSDTEQLRRPVLEATLPEQYMDHMVQPASYHMCTLPPGAMAPVMQ